MNIFERLFRNTLKPTEREELERETLKPTERELLEADAAWWKDSSGYWQAAWKQADADVAKYRYALMQIEEAFADGQSGTAAKATRMASEALS